jgi:hypothetical protein
MNIKSRITKLECKTMSHDGIIFIDAESSEDFRAQIRSQIEGGLDPAGKKFVYAQVPLRRLYDEIKGKSGSLVRDDTR